MRPDLVSNLINEQVEKWFFQKKEKKKKINK